MLNLTNKRIVILINEQEHAGTAFRYLFHNYMYNIKVMDNAKILTLGVPAHFVYKKALLITYIIQDIPKCF